MIYHYISDRYSLIPTKVCLFNILIFVLNHFFYTEKWFHFSPITSSYVKDVIQAEWRHSTKSKPVSSHLFWIKPLKTSQCSSTIHYTHNVFSLFRLSRSDNSCSRTSSGLFSNSFCGYSEKMHSNHSQKQDMFQIITFLYYFNLCTYYPPNFI